MGRPLRSWAAAGSNMYSCSDLHHIALARTEDRRFPSACWDYRREVVQRVGSFFNEQKEKRRGG